MLSYSRIILFFSLLALTAAAGGCRRGPTWNVASVEGTVTKDGRPLSGIEVIFWADADTVGPRASGMTDEAGHYRLRTDGGDYGAVAGSHRVCLRDGMPPKLLDQLSKEAVNAEDIQKKVREFHKNAAPDSLRVPPSYGSPNETPLRVEVRPGAQVIDLEVQ